MRPTRSRLSVVVETDDPALAVSDFRTFGDAGIDVTVCAGPATKGCPALVGRRCELIDGADVVLHRLDDRLLAAAVRREHPDVPVLYLSNDGEALPLGCAAISAKASVGGQLDAVQSAAVMHRGAHRRAAAAMAAGASPPEALRLERDLIASWSRHPSADR